MITVKIVGTAAMENIPYFMTIEKNEKNTVEEVIYSLHEKHGIPRKIYNKDLRKLASPFTGLVVIKNDEVVGMFYADGYEPLPNTLQSIKDGDRIIFILRAAGGIQ